jgi:hypothetical protein
LFDEAFYARSHADVGALPWWQFDHFVRAGVWEDRVAIDRPLVVLSAPFEPGGDRRKRLPARYRLLAPAEGERGESGFTRATRRIEALITSAELRSTIDAAAALEPRIGVLESIQSLVFPPLHDRLQHHARELRRRLPRSRYHTIVCIPWGRMGGADLVAALLSGALMRLEPGEPLLILTTDSAHFDWPEWFPAEADLVHASDLFTPLGGEAERLFQSMLLGLGPRRVFNVNSRLCWSTYRRYGARLARSMDLFAYLFCLDRDPDGTRGGYPVEFFAETVGAVRRYLTDTAALKAELTEMFVLPEAVADQVQPVYTPARSTLRAESAAVAGACSAADRTRPRILWAGRLDRQKRVDLLIGVAAPCRT